MPPSILIVDPSRQGRDFTASMFHALGQRYVWAAEDLARTRNFLDAVLFDYVVLDALIPGVHTNELIRLIRARSPNTTIAVLSHLSNAAARFADADYVLSKPLSFGDLQRLLEQKRVTLLR
jgi:DNA-binding response OmpR family regulator